MEESLWWFSFADPSRPEGQQFLGACIVGPAPSFKAAHLMTLLAHDLNPGGEARGHSIPPERVWLIPGDYCNRLLTRDECEDLDRLMLDRLPPEDRRRAP